MFIASPILGDIELHVSQPGGHTPEFWAELAMRRIMSVADTAPQPIRDQARAFREQAKQIIASAIQQATDEQKVYQDLERG